MVSVEGCDHAAISIIRRRGGVETVAATDEVPPRVDALQYQTGQGPCLDAIFDDTTYLIDDLTRDERWPPFSRRAARETGVRSILAFRLFVQEDTIGALNLYSRRPAAFNAHARAVGSVLAAHAAIALVAAREHDALRTPAGGIAVEPGNRDGDGRAHGAGQHHPRRGVQPAAGHLQTAHRKLREIAADVVQTGELPGRPQRRRRD